LERFHNYNYNLA